MLKKLKSALKSPKGSILALALKAAVFSGLLYFVNGQWLIAIVFLAAALYFYLRPSFNADKFLASFIILLTISLITINKLLITHYSFLTSLLLGFLFFILLGIKNLIFIKRESLYHFLNNLLLLIIFILFFRSSPYHLFFIKYLLLFFAIGLLSKEFLNFLIPELLPSQKKKVIIWSTSFLIAQFIWAINLLPINFLNAAALSFLAMFILQDFIIHHFSGTINRQIILRNITVFLVLTLIICGASKWSP
jgi:hypothetical protein